MSSSSLRFLILLYDNIHDIQLIFSLPEQQSYRNLLCFRSLISASHTFDPNLAAYCIVETHYLESQAWDRMGIFGKKQIIINSACLAVSGLGLMCSGLWVTNRVWEALSDPRCLSTNRESPKCSTRKPSTNQKARLSPLFHLEWEGPTTWHRCPARWDGSLALLTTTTLASLRYCSNPPSLLLLYPGNSDSSNTAISAASHGRYLSDSVTAVSPVPVPLSFRGAVAKVLISCRTHRSTIVQMHFFLPTFVSEKYEMLLRWFARLLDVFHPLSPYLVSSAWVNHIDLTWMEDRWMSPRPVTDPPPPSWVCMFEFQVLIEHVSKKNKNLSVGHMTANVWSSSLFVPGALCGGEKSGSTFSILFARFRLNWRELLRVGVHTTTTTTVSISGMRKLHRFNTDARDLERLDYK